MSFHHLRSLSPRIAVVCGVLALGAGGCGSADGAGTSSGTGARSTGPSVAAGPQRGEPGVNGIVAAVSGSTAQVQGPDGQVAVSWTASTTFTRQVDASLTDVVVGSCVLVQPGSDSAGAGTDEVAAATVRITPKGEDGTCGAGFGGPGGPPGSGDERPEMTATPPEGFEPPADGFRGFGGAVGEVTAVSVTGFTVLSRLPQPPTGDVGVAPEVEESSVAVTVSASTSYTTTGSGTADDVVVGTCLRAEGSTDGTGALTATSVALTPATDGACETVLRAGSRRAGS